MKKTNNEVFIDMKTKEFDILTDEILLEETKKLIQEQIDRTNEIIDKIRRFKSLTGFGEKVEVVDDGGTATVINVKDITPEDLIKCCGGDSLGKAQTNLMQGIHQDLEECGYHGNDVDIDTQGDENMLGLIIKITPNNDELSIENNTDMTEQTDNGELKNTFGQSMYEEKPKDTTPTKDDEKDLILGDKELDEKWDTDYETPESEKGKYKGKNLEDLKKMKSSLDKKRPEGGYKKGSPEYEKEKELNFAIRAKKGWKGDAKEQEQTAVGVMSAEEDINEHHKHNKSSQIEFICKNDKSAKKEDLEKLSDKEVEKKYVALEKKMGLYEHHKKDKASQIEFICKNDKSCKKEDLEKLSDEEVEKKYVALEKKMGLTESKKKVVRLTAKEMEKLVENIIKEAKIETPNMRVPANGVPGLDVTNKNRKDSGKENADALKAVEKKIKDVLSFEGNTDPEFPEPVGKGEQKVATKNTDSENDVVDLNRGRNPADLTYDQEPAEQFKERSKLSLVGAAKMGNAQTDEDGNGLGNVVPSKTGENIAKVAEKRKEARVNEPIYDKEAVPVDEEPNKKDRPGPGAGNAGDATASEILRMKQLSNYSEKTQ